MTQSTRKLVGTFLTLGSIVVWCVLATAIYMTLLQGQNQIVLLIYFIVAGMGWCLPAMAIIRWMARPDAPPTP